MFFENRMHAAQKLADSMKLLGTFDNYGVVSLARGGVPIGFGISQEFGLPMCALLLDDAINPSTKKQYFVTPFGDIIVIEKQGIRILPKDAHQDMCSAVLEKMNTTTLRQRHYNGTDFRTKRKVILCDDGVVSGKTAFAAAHVLREHFGVEEILLAVPVVPRSLEPSDIGADKLLYFRRSSLEMPPTGMFYKHFDDVSDEEVVALVQQH